MTVYLGTLGRMIPIYSTPSAQIETEERFNFKRTVEGSRKAEIIPGGRRSWSLNAQFADPTESATLMEFANGSWGRGPFVFVSADAPQTNLLTPAAASCDSRVMSPGTGTSLLGSPPLLTPDGWAARSVWKSAGGSLAVGEPIPVLPGGTVTGSAYVSGIGGFVRLQFLNAAGSEVAIHNSADTGSSVERRSISRVVPSGAVSVRLWVSASVTAAAHPAITWTDVVQPWSDGQGCLKAVVSGFTRDQVLAVVGHTFSNVSFTVTEVG